MKSIENYRKIFKFHQTIVAILLSISFFIHAQSDSVDVTFFYKPQGNPAIVYLPGEFNNWGNNSGGSISDPRFAMNLDIATGIWSKTVRLRVGGPEPLPNPSLSIPGAYQYKFNENGSPSGWLPDPLNPRQNPRDNNNSYLFVRDPTIHYLLPNSTAAVGVIRTRFPEITAYIFPAEGSAVDTAAITVKIDQVEYSNIGGTYDPGNHKLSFTSPDPLADGSHQLILTVKSTAGSESADTTSFTVQGSRVQLFTRTAETHKASWRIQGAFFKTDGSFDSTLTTAQLVRADSAWNVQVSEGKADTTISLLEGDNIFHLQAEIDGQLQMSEPLTITRIVNHSPAADILITQDGNTLHFSAANSVDPDAQPLSFLWMEDPQNPEILGIEGQTDPEVSASLPASAGEYFVELTAEDPDANRDFTRAFVVVEEDNPQARVAGYADNPSWLKNGRIYLVFFKAFTSEGTIQAAIPNLAYIKDMGFNIIWVLPVMDVPGDMDNQINIGYNIIDFLNVDPSIGSNEDFKEFVQAAHDLDIKVILDITPNHTGRDHPFAREARLYREFSPFWNYYQTEFIPHADRAGGQSMTPEGIVYYNAFSDALLNYNWADLDARLYMTGVYEYWIREAGVDGFRLDAYWGPRLKYGKENMGVPVRKALKHIKPDILLLGEDNATGFGTEVSFADAGGGLDAAYDFQLYHDAFRTFSFTRFAVNTLHARLENDGFYPGENAYFLRFLENQDEDRITYVHDSFVETMPLATVLFTAPGLPQIHNGQEVGYGRGLGAPGEPDLNDRRRGVIDWDFGGRDLLRPHYQRLAHIRAQFAAFSQHAKDTNGDGQVNNQDESDFERLNTGNELVYAFLRPFTAENGLAVVNFSRATAVTMDLTTANLKFADGFNPAASYWVNNLYTDTSYQVLGSDLQNFTVSLPTLGSAVYVIATQKKTVDLPPLPTPVGIAGHDEEIAKTFSLFQNYPNPFNPRTTIEFHVARSAHVKLLIYNILGQKVRLLTDKIYPTGRHRLLWNGRNDVGNPVSSGIYIIRLEADQFVSQKRMVLLR